MVSRVECNSATAAAEQQRVQPAAPKGNLRGQPACMVWTSAQRASTGTPLCTSYDGLRALGLA